MALIDCPECGNQISEQASICPNCGFKIGKYKAKRRIENSAITIKQKIKTAFQNIIVKNKKIIIATVLVSASLFCVLLVADALCRYYDRLEYERDVFNYVSANKYEPLGLTADNNIIGKDITAVMSELFKNKACVYETEESSCSYTFTRLVNYPIGEEAELTIHANRNNLVDTVEYSFFFDNALNSSGLRLYRILNEITEYYQVEATYTYMDENEELIRFSEENAVNFIQNNELVYHIFWEVGDLVVILRIPHIDSTEKCLCSIFFLGTTIDDSFTNPNINHPQC
jgi:hypothetical protein